MKTYLVLYRDTGSVGLPWGLHQIKSEGSFGKVWDIWLREKKENWVAYQITRV